MPRPNKPLITDRFWSKVLFTDSCWEWQGCTNNTGYGTFALSHRVTVMAHRFAYELTGTPIPPGHLIMHHCDNPRCVNPDHLSPGTTHQNFHDMLAKGRGEHIWKPIEEEGDLAF